MRLIKERENKTKQKAGNDPIRLLLFKKSQM